MKHKNTTKITISKLIFSSLILCSITSIGIADASLPNQDINGSKDHPLLQRFEGSFIVSYLHNHFDEFKIPLSKLIPVENQRDDHNNRIYKPKMEKVLEGEYTRLVYLLPNNRSPLEVLRNYQDEIHAKNGKILYECKGTDCGGDTTLSSGGGGGNMSLSMYLFPENKITDPNFSNGKCAMTEDINNQRYTVLELADSNAHVSILTYTLKDNLYCKALNNRTIAIIDIIKNKVRKNKMVTVKAKEMAEKISTDGSVALYGIFFDSDKANIKAKSTPAIKQISKLLQENKELELLVVGHTDNVGDFFYNMNLSQSRADAVVNKLVAKYKIKKNRLKPMGISFSSPITSNKTEEGKAKNRRVELVEK